jgi:hypothetical protein
MSKKMTDIYKTNLTFTSELVIKYATPDLNLHLHNELVIYEVEKLLRKRLEGIYSINKIVTRE